MLVAKEILSSMAIGRCGRRAWARHRGRGRSGDTEGLSRDEAVDAESVELAAEGQGEVRQEYLDGS